MAFDIVPGRFWTLPNRISSFIDDDEDWSVASANSGISISEDDQHIYVETAVPGIDPQDIEVTFDKGIVWIKGETEKKDERKKYYREMTSSFSYRVAIPGDIDTRIEPEAVCKNGVMQITFAKSPTSQPKKIAVKAN